MIKYVVGINLNMKHFYIKSVGRLSKNINIMEFEQEEALEPMSPTAQYLKSSVLSLTIMVVLEVEVPIDDSMTIPLLKDVFLPINHRFASIMVSVMIFMLFVLNGETRVGLHVTKCSRINVNGSS